MLPRVPAGAGGVTPRQQDWSPEQIAGWPRQTRPEDEQVHGSHETIYRSRLARQRPVVGRRGAMRRCVLVDVGELEQL